MGLVGIRVDIRAEDLRLVRRSGYCLFFLSSLSVTCWMLTVPWIEGFFSCILVLFLAIFLPFSFLHLFLCYKACYDTPYANVDFRSCCFSFSFVIFLHVGSSPAVRNRHTNID